MVQMDMRFDVVDYIIFALLLFFSAAIGLFYGFIDKRRQNKKNKRDGIEESKSSAKEYLLANKSMGVGWSEVRCIHWKGQHSFRYFPLEWVYLPVSCLLSQSWVHPQKFIPLELSIGSLVKPWMSRIVSKGEIDRFHIGISYIFTIYITATLFMPMFVKLEVTSAYEVMNEKNSCRWCSLELFSI